MNITTLHQWAISPKQAVQLQKTLASKIIDNTPLHTHDIQYVAGVDVSVKNNISRAAVVVLRFPELTVTETVTATMPTPFPYIPGLLSFREGPVLVQAFEQLHQEPDVFIFDGMGRMHPRRIGIASHIGLWLNKPTIGCGKTHFIGTYDEPDNTRGAYCHVMDHGEIVGVVLRTRVNVKPVYISTGHRINLESAITITLACTPKYRLPEPIRQAHNAAGSVL
ncbi:MAG: deoxyribonuclease V [Phototrophicales bacterium]|nr:MAG: deoxyribonuclease V [Phototrophicales bacterium]